MIHFNLFPLTGYRRILAFLSVFVMTGCAVLTPICPYRDLALPVQESISSEMGPLERVNSPPLPRPTKLELTLDRVIEIAIKNNPGLAAASSDVEVALAKGEAARSALFPEVTAEAGYARHLDDQRLLPAWYNGEPGVYGDDLFSGDLLVRVPVFAGGKRINAFRAADLMRQSTHYDLARTREELIYTVSSLFFTILSQERLITSLRFSENTLESHFKRIGEMMAVKKAAMVDRLRTEVRLASVRERMVRETNRLQILYHTLFSQMGIGAVEKDVRIQGELKSPLPEAVSPEGYIRKALDHRADYQSVRRKLEAQARLVDIVRAGHAPEVLIIGAYGGRWAANPTDTPEHARDSEDMGRIGLIMELPLFDGGETSARIREERAKLAATQKRLQNLEFQIRLDVETALMNMTSASERVRTTEKSIEQARESLRIEQEKYQLGRGAILDVLDAQAALLETETNYYQALADLNIAILQIRLSTGESFQ